MTKSQIVPSHKVSESGQDVDKESIASSQRDQFQFILTRFMDAHIGDMWQQWQPILSTGERLQRSRDGWYLTERVYDGGTQTGIESRSTEQTVGWSVRGVPLPFEQIQTLASAVELSEPALPLPGSPEERRLRLQKRRERFGPVAQFLRVSPQRAAYVVPKKPTQYSRPVQTIRRCGACHCRQYLQQRKEINRFVKNGKRQT